MTQRYVRVDFPNIPRRSCPYWMEGVVFSTNSHLGCRHIVMFHVVPRSLDKIVTRFRRLCPYILGPAIHQKNWEYYSNVTGREKSKVAATKMEILISELVDFTGMRFERLNQRFRGSSIQRIFRELLTRITRITDFKYWAIKLTVACDWWNKIL